MHTANQIAQAQNALSANSAWAARIVLTSGNYHASYDYEMLPKSNETIAMSSWSSKYRKALSISNSTAGREN